MPIVDFHTLPDDARVWVFGIDRVLDSSAAGRLLVATDIFLEGWAAHGVPLHAARAWRDDRFLVIAVDQSGEGASGCSIDGLFRALGSLERELGISLRGGGRVFYRTPKGDIACVSRDEFAERASAGEITADTPVFDTSITSLGDFRRDFERPASRSWHAQLADSLPG
ncbi:MAG TPA: hypothetical protein VFK13_11550 [Gemmatimonadaceae bacterium]|nr:hypothetical protein [Gemmatimonadaceae bacterium]